MAPSDEPLLASPGQLRRRWQPSARAAASIPAQRQAISELVHGTDERLLAVVGPCSVHDPAAALDYAARLAPIARRLAPDVLVVMRTYLEKPRSTVGWKGLINDPALDGSCSLQRGLDVARELLCGVVDLGLPVATELLDPNLAPYLTDLVSWAAIGARTTESQPHRELASHSELPIGFKNGTDGSLDGALGGLVAAAEPHTRLATDDHGRLRVLRSAGNADCHLTLRGGKSGPNFDRASVDAASERAAVAGLPRRVLVDCSHGNSRKNHENKARVVDSIASQVASGSDALLGIMLESHLVAGRQDLGADPSALRYGQSITDACIDLVETEALLEQLASAQRLRKR